MSVANLSPEDKDRVLAALMQANPQMVAATVQRVTGTTPPKSSRTGSGGSATKASVQSTEGATAASRSTKITKASSEAAEAALTTMRHPGVVRKKSTTAQKRQTALPTRNKKRSRASNGNTGSKLKNIPKSQLWQTRFDELVRYKQQYGNVLVPVASKTHPHLGRWVDNQRYGVNVAF